MWLSTRLRAFIHRRMPMARWSDPYGKGWEQGRRDTADDIRAALVRQLPSLTVIIGADEFIDVQDILVLVEQAKDPNFHPERTHR